MALDEPLAERLRDHLADVDGVTEKRMFGGVAFLIGGNLAVGASGEGGLLLRIDPTERAELLERPHGQPFVMRGKTMEGWMRIDLDGSADEEELRGWVAIGVAYARSLPPK